MIAAPVIGAGGGGGKGGGGGSRSPVESPDSLRSRSYARIIDLLCEGEIEGLATGDLKSVYFDDTPVQNDDGSYNFAGVNLLPRNGSQSQAYIPGFPSVESEQAVNLEVTKTTPVVRTITSSVYSLVRVTISIPSLSYTNTGNGDTSGTSVSFAIDVQANGGGYVEKKTDTISGKTSSKYQRSYLITLTGSAPWNIRVRRLTDDSGTSFLQNKTVWDSYTEITEAKLRYPNSALAAVVVDSQQFNSIPRRGYDLKLLRVRVPSNYNAATRAYTGTWDGTFQIAWTDNPAWCFYDLLTNDRYGLGGFIDVGQVDKWSLYQIGKYCDELVDDGFGGTEPRFTCNLYIQSQAEAYRVIQDMASVFRGLVFWAQGQITAVQDAPADPVMLFTNANIVDGLFTYTGSGLKTRHSVALVYWNDPDDNYRRKPEYVEDSEAVARYGIVSTSIAAVGCTSRGQAHRIGKWLLYSETNETETVSFRAGLDSALVRPGQIFAVQDADRAGARQGGRVVSAPTNSYPVVGTDSATKRFDIDGNNLSRLPPASTFAITGSSTGNNGTYTVASISYLSGSNKTRIITVETIPANGGGGTLTEVSVVSLTLDNGFTMAGGATYTLSVVLPNGTVGSAVVASIAGAIVTLATPLAIAPQANAVWVVSSTLVASQMFRTVAVTDIGDGIFEISGLKHLPQKYDVVENDLVLTENPISLLNTPPDAPVSVDITDVLYASAAEVKLAIQFSWAGVERADSYTVAWRVNNGNMNTVTGIRAQLLEVRDAVAGVYEVYVYAVSVTQKRSQPAIKTKEILGKSNPPGDVQSFSLVNIGGGVVQLSWAQAVDLDVLIGGWLRLRHTPDTTSPSWSNAVDIGEAIPGSATTASVPALPGTYLAKFVDSSGYSSFSAAVAQTSISNLISLNVVQTINESSFTGAKTNTVMDSGLRLLETSGVVASTGEYLFASTVDLGAKYTNLITASMSAISYDLTNLFDSAEYFDSTEDFDGAGVDGCNAVLWIRTTDDNPAGAPVWSSWRPFFVGQYVARAFQFKLTLTSSVPTQNIKITSLSVTVDMPDRVQAGQGLVSGAASYSVTFPAAFKATPAIGITASNMATGDYYVLSAVAATGFTVTFRNAAGTAVSRTFDYLAKGYGYQS